MRVLVLDDDDYRHFMFNIAFKNHYVKNVRNVAEAVEALKEETWDLVQLDHDLADVHYHELKAGKVGELTGMDVAVHIARYMDREKLPTRVVVHSWNPPGAKAMVEILRDAGISVVYQPFNPDMAEVP